MSALLEIFDLAGPPDHQGVHADALLPEVMDDGDGGGSSLLDVVGNKLEEGEASLTELVDDKLSAVSNVREGGAVLTDLLGETE